MRISTVVVGSIFGAILVGMLAAPLFVSLPARYVTDWFYVTSGAAVLGLVAALGTLVCGGFLAATLDSDEAVRAGTSAGLISAIVAGVALVLPASEIEACGAVLSLAMYDAMPAERLREIAADTAIDGVWIPAMTGIVLLLAGPALGAVGGVVFDLWQGSPGRSNRTIRRSMVPFLGLAAATLAVFTSTTWAIHLDITVLPRLGYPPTWAERTALSSPLLVTGAATAWLFAWAVRDAVLVWRSDARFLGATAILLASSAPIGMAVIVCVMHPRSLLTPSPWIAGFVVLLSGLVSAWLASNSDVPLETHPRQLGELVGEAMLAGLFTVGTWMFVSGASIVGTFVIVFPYVRALLGGAALVEAPPATLVTQVFGTHEGAMLAILLVAFLYLGILGPLWLFGRIVARR